MRCFLTKSLFVLFPLLASCAFSRAQGKPPIRNGYWWTDSSLQFKLGFVAGYASAMGEAADIAGFECIAKKNGGTLPAKVPPNEVLDACISSPAVARFDFQKITRGQLQEGLDAFYGDFRNKAIDIGDAIWYVRDQLKGKTAAELEKELEEIRA